MLRQEFNQEWAYRRLGRDEEWQKISLPHDAMICEKRVPESDGGTNTGWYECFDYEYIKKFVLSAEALEKLITFEFEGVYRNAEVFINGKKAAARPYGYTNFYVSANEYLKVGENEMRVVARNADQPNSRWYSGAGIYRPVWMYSAEKSHVLMNGVRVRTLSIDPVSIEIEIKTTGAGTVGIEIVDGDKTIYSKNANTSGSYKAVIELDDARLWSPDDPYLYKLIVRFGNDVSETSFGIRTLQCDSKKGFCLNGKRIIIRGACMHHDNGLLGACGFPDAEERKIRLLKEAGYNAVRSAHNPCSKALLDACDKLGVMMMDEYVDMWYIHKTLYDYADFIEEWYERDITDLVEKDFNHPCVIMYSLGNEVSETAQARGIEFFKKMKAKVDELDGTRPVTTGVNIFFNYLSSKGFGVYSDKKAKENPQKKVGSEFFNNIAGIMGAGFMKWGATLRGSDRTTRDSFAAMDVAGYNYGVRRYRKDVVNYPDRVILGSETFCADAYYFYECAKKHNALIGDFVWAGIDYLGELGIGSWEYRDYAPHFTHGVGWISAGSGRIDITGKPLAEAAYTRTAFELNDKPTIAVVPVNHTTDKHSPSSWKMSNAIESWSWRGCEGNKAKVEVYARAAKVELYVNGKLVGTKKYKGDCKFEFTTKYQNGEITAIAYDENGQEIANSSLKTGGKETKLSVAPESVTVTPGGLAFIRLKFTDNDGIVKPLERHRIKVSVGGGKLIALGHGCPYNPDGYLGDDTDTYFGEALAIVQADKSGKITVKAESGEMTGEAVIGIKE